MTKLYYDDPLKAAWMAREFGVVITTAAGLKLYNLGCGMATAPEFGKQAVYHTAPYYIHPDSLHIFEPKIGDIDIKGNEVFHIDEEYIYFLECGFIETDEELDIAVRDGKHFFMPLTTA